MRIANVAICGMNRYRSRVRDWLEKRRPDVLTLQKIGLDEEFCEEEFLKVGYRSTFVGGRSGPSSPVGVAILSHRALPQPKVCARGLKGAKQGESGFLTVDIGGLWVSSVVEICRGNVRPLKSHSWRFFAEMRRFISS